MKKDCKIGGLIEFSLKNFCMGSPSLIIDYEPSETVYSNKKEYSKNLAFLFGDDENPFCVTINFANN